MTVDYGAPAGTRDTREFYADGDPLRWVDHSLIDAIAQRAAGRRLLDLGCGAGGYSRVLMDRGYDVLAFDVNPTYVAKARALGVDANLYDGARIPLADAAVDTVFMIEVLEHVPAPDTLLGEVRRVAATNLVATVPNNTQRFNDLIAWSHMLDVDHKNFFTVDSLRTLLGSRFTRVDVEEIVSADHLVAGDLLGKWSHRVYRLFVALGIERPHLFFRLLADAR